MNQGWAVVLAAAITASGGVVVAILQRLRKENRTDHNHVTQRLDWIHDAMSRVETKVDGHIQWHVEGADSGRPVETDQNQHREP